MANLEEITTGLWFDSENQHYYQQDPAVPLQGAHIRKS